MLLMVSQVEEETTMILEVMVQGVMIMEEDLTEAVEVRAGGRELVYSSHQLNHHRITHQYHQTISQLIIIILIMLVQQGNPITVTIIYFPNNYIIHSRVRRPEQGQETQACQGGQGLLFCNMKQMQEAELTGRPGQQLSLAQGQVTCPGQQSCRGQGRGLQSMQLARGHKYCSGAGILYTFLTHLDP